jgi:hypothetical protein
MAATLLRPRACVWKCDGCKVAAVFSDRAKSGASIVGRRGMAELIAVAKEHTFDILAVEKLDHLSRGQSDLVSIYDARAEGPPRRRRQHPRGQTCWRPRLWLATSDRS